jgi:hypothetical protein
MQIGQVDQVDKHHEDWFKADLMYGQVIEDPKG